MQREEGDLFDRVMAQRRGRPRLLKNKEVLGSSYTPAQLPHREAQINQLASILVDALEGGAPSNAFIFGKTGTGKTATVRYVGQELMKKGQEMNKKVLCIYINHFNVDTQYRVLAHIGNRLTTRWDELIPFTGWPTDKVMAKLIDNMDRRRGVIVIIMDEVDRLIAKSGDDVLYNLTRLNADLKYAQTSVIGISNDLMVTELLDPRVKSSLAQKELIFPPYTATQLSEILTQRAEMAFHNMDQLEGGVIPLCAALAAQEHGDARKALALLRVAAELAERDGMERVDEAHVRMAIDQIETDRIAPAIRSMPSQLKAVLMSIVSHRKATPMAVTTGDVYSTYQEVSAAMGLERLSARRVYDLISELDMLGLVHASVISKGRHGRTREIKLAVYADHTESVLKEDPLMSSIGEIPLPPLQQRLSQDHDRH